MDFSAALQELKSGKRITRGDSGAWLAFVQASAQTPEHITSSDGDGEHQIALASDDLLACDWSVLEIVPQQESTDGQETEGTDPQPAQELESAGKAKSSDRRGKGGGRTRGG